MNTILYKVKYKYNFIKKMVTYFRQPLYQPKDFLFIMRGTNFKFFLQLLYRNFHSFLKKKILSVNFYSMLMHTFTKSVNYKFNITFSRFFVICFKFGGCTNNRTKNKLLNENAFLNLLNCWGIIISFPSIHKFISYFKSHLLLKGF